MSFTDIADTSKIDDLDQKNCINNLNEKLLWLVLMVFRDLNSLECNTYTGEFICILLKWSTLTQHWLISYNSIITVQYFQFVQHFSLCFQPCLQGGQPYSLSCPRREVSTIFFLTGQLSKQITRTKQPSWLIFPNSTSSLF